MKKTYLLLIIIAFSLQAAAQKLTVNNLICEYKDNPIGVDAAMTRLGWKLASEQRNTLQTAYEIRVGTDSKSLASGKGFVWQTGKVNSDQSVHVSYSGAALQPRQRYYWQVRVWDNHGNQSPWSTVKFWETGLLNKTGWSAK